METLFHLNHPIPNLALFNTKKERTSWKEFISPGKEKQG